MFLQRSVIKVIIQDQNKIHENLLALWPKPGVINGLQELSCLNKPQW